MLAWMVRSGKCRWTSAMAPMSVMIAPSTPQETKRSIFPEHGRDLVGLHVGVDRHPQLGAARVGDADGGAHVVVGHLVLVAPPAPAARPHVDGVRAARDRRLDHRKIACRRQKLDHAPSSTRSSSLKPRTPPARSSGRDPIASGRIPA